MTAKRLIMQTDVAQAVSRQINILTGALGVAVVFITAILAYLKVSTANAIAAAVIASQEKIELKIIEATKELKQELARKDLVDTKFSELERRLTKTETWREAAVTTLTAKSTT